MSDVSETYDDDVDSIAESPKVQLFDAQFEAARDKDQHQQGAEDENEAEMMEEDEKMDGQDIDEDADDQSAAVNVDEDEQGETDGTTKKQAKQQHAADTKKPAAKRSRRKSQRASTSTDGVKASTKRTKSGRSKPKKPLDADDLDPTKKSKKPAPKKKTGDASAKGKAKNKAPASSVKKDGVAVAEPVGDEVNASPAATPSRPKAKRPAHAATSASSAMSPTPASDGHGSRSRAQVVMGRVPRNAYGVPVLPISMGPVTLHSLGHVEFASTDFFDEDCIFPCGFALSRREVSTVDPTKDTTYLFEVREDEEDETKPTFVVTDVENEIDFYAESADKAWAAVIRAATQSAKDKGLEDLKIKNKRTQGRAMFMLDNAVISALINELPNAGRCRGYKDAASATKEVSETDMKPFQKLDRTGSIQSVLEERMDGIVIPESFARKKHMAAPMVKVATTDGAADEAASDDASDGEGSTGGSKRASPLPKLVYNTDAPAAEQLASLNEYKETLLDLMFDVMEKKDEAGRKRLRQIKRRMRKLNRQIDSLRTKPKKPSAKSSGKQTSGNKAEQDAEHARVMKAYQEAQKLMQEQAEKKRTLAQENVELARQLKQKKKDAAKEEKLVEQKKEKIQRQQQREQVEADRRKEQRIKRFGQADENIEHSKEIEQGEPVDWLGHLLPAEMPDAQLAEAMFSDALSLTEFFSSFPDLFDIKASHGLAAMAKVLFGCDTQTLHLAQEVHAALLAPLVTADSVAKHTATEWLSRIPINQASFTSIARFYLESHSVFVVEFPEVIEELRTQEYTAIRPTSRLTILCFLREQCLGLPQFRENMEANVFKAAHLRGQITKLRADVSADRDRTLACDLKPEDNFRLHCEILKFLRHKAAMFQLYAAIRSVEDAGRLRCLIFLRLPSKKEMPEYYKVIRKPIDMETILENIRGDKYYSLDQCTKDFELMWQNALTFNAPESEVYVDAQYLQTHARRVAAGLQTHLQAEEAKDVPELEREAKEAKEAAEAARAKALAAEEASKANQESQSQGETQESANTTNAAAPANDDGNDDDGADEDEDGENEYDDADTSMVDFGVHSVGSRNGTNEVLRGRENRETLRKLARNRRMENVPKRIQEAFAALNRCYDSEILELELEISEYYSVTHGMLLGKDRNFRSYYAFHNLPGVYVNLESSLNGAPQRTFATATELEQAAASRAGGVRLVGADDEEADMDEDDEEEEEEEEEENAGDTQAEDQATKNGVEGDTADSDAKTSAPDGESQPAGNPGKNSQSSESGKPAPSATPTPTTGAQIDTVTTATSSEAPANADVQQSEDVDMPSVNADLPRGEVSVAQPEDSQPAFKDTDASQTLSQRALALYTSVDCSNGPLWRCFADEESINALIASLEPKGKREKALRRKLTRFKPRILERAAIIYEEEAAQLKRLSRTSSHDADTLRQGALQSNLRHVATAVLNFHHRLNTRHFVTEEDIEGVPFDFVDWKAKLQRAQLTIDDIRTAIFELHNFTHVGALRRSWRYERDAWAHSLMAATTAGELACYQQVFESTIMWKRKELSQTASGGAPVPHSWRGAPIGSHELSGRASAFSGADDSMVEAEVPVETCTACEEPGELLHCALCSNCYHLGCLNPPFESMPEEEWFCPSCHVPRKVLFAKFRSSPFWPCRVLQELPGGRMRVHFFVTHEVATVQRAATRKFSPKELIRQQSMIKDPRYAEACQAMQKYKDLIESEKQNGTKRGASMLGTEEADVLVNHEDSAEADTPSTPVKHKQDYDEDFSPVGDDDANENDQARVKRRKTSSNGSKSSNRELDEEDQPSSPSVASGISSPKANGRVNATPNSDKKLAPLRLKIKPRFHDNDETAAPEESSNA